MKRIYAIALVIVIVAGIGVTYFILLNQSSPPVGCGLGLEEGNVAYYSGDSSITCHLNLTKDSILTGGFTSNASMLFFLMNSTQYFKTGSLNPIPQEYIYATGSTTSLNLNTTLPAGTYYLFFYFTYKYMIHSANGSAWAGATQLNVTKTFMATQIR